jgi:zinc protease
MTVIVDEMHVSPIVALARWVRAGSADEPGEHSGVHHFLEHMLLKGTGDRQSLASLVQGAGGYMNARTGLDHTAFYQVVPSEAWRSVLESVERVLAATVFAESTVDTERRVVIDEGNIAERDPSMFTWRRLMEAAFPESGYGRPIVGIPQSLANVDGAVLSAYLARHYVPSNMVQVIVGDVDADEVVSYAADLASNRGPVSREGPAVGTALRFESPGWCSARRVYRRDVRQSYLGIAFKSPSVMHQDTPAADVLCGLLGVGRSSRLRKSLRTSLGLVSDVVAATVGHRDTGIIAVRATGSEGVEPARIVEEVFREIRLLKDEPIDLSEAVKGVRRLEAGYALEHETVESIAMTLGFFATMGDHRYAEEYVDRLAAVTPDDLTRVARTYLRAENAAVVSMVPRGAADDDASDVDTDVRALSARSHSIQQARRDP